MAYGTIVHHTVERAVLDSHQIPFSMPLHHYIRYCYYDIIENFIILIDNPDESIEIIYDIYLLSSDAFFANSSSTRSALSTGSFISPEDIAIVLIESMPLSLNIPSADHRLFSFTFLYCLL